MGLVIPIPVGNNILYAVLVFAAIVAVAPFVNKFWRKYRDED